MKPEMNPNGVALLAQVRDALLALRLANENAPCPSQWQRQANALADAALEALARHEAPAGGEGLN